MRTPEELRDLTERTLTTLPLAEELGGLEEAVRYSLLAGGKRVRPVLCLATGEALGRDAEELLPAACALELVHTFSLVHDDLPALDDDELRRGRPSSHVRFGEGVAILAGDALLAEAFRLALSFSEPEVARVLAEATLGMIGGQYLDVTAEGRAGARGARAPARAEDRAPPRGVRRMRPRGRGPSRGRPHTLARLRTRRRAALPDRRRHPRRHGHGRGARKDAGEGRGGRQGDLRLPPRPRAGPRARRRDARSSARRPGGDPRRHVRPRGAGRSDPRAPGLS